MKILYVSYDGMTDALGRSQVIPYLVGLAGKGFKIYVISCEKRNIDPSERSEVQAIFDESKITWNPLAFSTRPPWISKLRDVINIRKTAKRLHKQEKFDVVHCRSYIAALAGLDLKLMYDTKFVFDMRGFWANERIEGDIWNLSNPLYAYIYKYFKKKEIDFFHHADAVVSLTHNGKSEIERLFGAEVSQKTTVIPCCVDVGFFSRDNITPEQTSALMEELGFTNGDIIISYLGSTGTWYMTDEMLLFFKKLQSKIQHAKFLFISGDQPQFILKKAQFHDIPKESIVITRASRNNVPLYLSLSSISIFFIKPVFSKKASSPTKQAEIMSMGIPLICNAGVGDTDMLFADEKTGLVLKDFSEEEFSRAIERLESVMQLNPDEIRKKAIEFFNLEDGVRNYEAIYKRITQN